MGGFPHFGERIAWFCRVLGYVVTLGACGTALRAAEEDSFSAEQVEYFEKQVRPLFVEHCLKCHGTDKPKGGLQLNSRQTLLQGGDTGPGIVPGKPSEGELLKAIQYDADGYQMPPEGKLPEAAIAIIQKWIEMGAPWPTEAGPRADALPGWEQEFEKRAQRWSFQPLRRVVPPAVTHGDWPRTPIDRFLLARIEAAGLVPAGDVDRSTWIRRAYFDTIGLPPSPEVVEAFVRDDSPDAFERIVDQLLASPRMGERWSRHWLDLVRYAESRGHEFDYDVANPWHYRDYVVRAMNDDLPYNRFVVEQVAGDLMEEERTVAPWLRSPLSPHPSVATGFWYLGEWVHSPVDIRKDETERIDNMLDVFSKTFLGLTVACARCHDHKFDPISQKDYYALAGYIRSTSYAQRPFETLSHNRRIQEQLRGLDAQAAGPITAVYQQAAQPVLDQLNHYLLATRELLATPLPMNPEGDADQALFDDFEAGTYEGWELTGDAFSPIPQTQETIAPYQGSVQAHGKYFVNSHQFRNGQKGDDHVGTMTSREFRIEGETLRFLIGGGPHKGKTCINLLIDGQVALSATGHSSNQMRTERWDLRVYRGKLARLQIVDQERGGWGNIGIDHLVMERTPTSQIEIPAFQERLSAMARQKGLRPDVLLAWVRFAVQQAEVPQSPWNGWARFATGQAPVLPSTGDAPPDTEPVGRALPLLAQDGVYYHWSPSEPPRIWLSENPEAPIAAMASSSRAARIDPDFSGVREREGTLHDVGVVGSLGRSGRTLRTATWTIQSGQIAALVQGGCATYIVVDSHAVVLGPLHGSIVKKHPADPQWHWVMHDVSRYKGHQAHVEIVADAGGDFACEAICEIDQPPPAVKGWPSVGLLNLAGTGQLPPAALDWIRQHPELLGLNTPDVRAQLAVVARPWIEQRQQLVAQIQAVSSMAPVMLEGSRVDEELLIRGNSNKPSGLVPRRFIELFHGVGPEATQAGSGRLELAMQMVDPEQTPIVPRVIVNRLWHHYFGRGLVPTPDDFGYMGELPSHPELLDWMATELIREEWSMKQLHRMILLSSAYRMQVQSEPTGTGIASQGEVAVSPAKLYAHRTPKRLEGEIIRDALFQLSKRADDRMYGPSVPIALTAFQDGRGRPGSGPVDGAGRRSLYLSTRRNFAESFLTAFDLPNPHTSVGRRSVSNVPAQALALLNSPMVMEQTRLWGERLCRETPEASTPARIQQLYMEAFSRQPSPKEGEAAAQFIQESAAANQLDENAPRVWAELCHALVNVKEFVYIP